MEYLTTFPCKERIMYVVKQLEKDPAFHEAFKKSNKHSIITIAKLTSTKDMDFAINKACSELNIEIEEIRKNIKPEPNWHKSYIENCKTCIDIKRYNDTSCR